jgi:hypothetical protein
LGTAADVAPGDRVLSSRARHREVHKLDILCGVVPYLIGRESCVSEDLRVDKKNVGHGQKSHHPGPNFFAHAGPALFDAKVFGEASMKALPWFRARDIVAGEGILGGSMPVAPNM